MKETEIAWLAGILEGEACFDWNQGSKEKWPRIRIEMKDKDIIYRVKSLVDNIPTAKLKPIRAKIRHRISSNPKHSDTYTLQLARADIVGPILFMIRPWMSERRGKLIDQMLNYLYPRLFR